MPSPTTTTASAHPATDDDALALVRQVAATAPAGYVALQTAPYRAHHLLAREALALTDAGDRVFEGGVSSGYFAQVLAAAGRVVDGAELDPVQAERAAAVCDRVFVGDLGDLDLAGLRDDYDLLLFGDTLEHLARPEELLAGLRDHLTDDGHLIVSIPNIANWSIRLMLLAGRFRYTDRGILDRTHLRFYTVATLPGMLADAGFDMIRLQASVPVPGLTAEPLCRMAHRVGNLRPGFFGYNLIATCRKSVGAHGVADGSVADR